MRGFLVHRIVVVLVLDAFRDAEEVLGLLRVVDREFRPNRVSVFVEDVFATVDFLELLGDGAALEDFFVAA